MEREWDVENLKIFSSTYLPALFTSFLKRKQERINKLQ